MKHYAHTIVKLSKIAGLIALGLLLGACGGGSGGGTSPPPAAGGGDTQPSTNSFTVGGSVVGLTSSGIVALTLQNNGANNLAISADGNFSFSDALASGSSYTVAVYSITTVAAKSGGESCSVTNGAGTINGANITNIRINCSTQSYTVGGSVSGLTGTGLTLQNGNTLAAVSANGGFTFTSALANGAGYSVSVASQPTGQLCSVTNGAGTINSANVTNVQVSCATALTYSIGGTVAGLGTGKSLVLRNNGGDDRTVTTNGPFSFVTTLANSASYNVTIATQPAGQTCSVSNGSATVSGAHVSSVQVTCITPTYTLSGNVTGLASGGSVVLQNNGGDNLTVSANGGFTFTTALAGGVGYNVTILTQPSGQSCSVTNGSGTVGSANVSTIQVSCTKTYTIGGSVSGLSNVGLVLQNNSGDNLTVSFNGPFTFATMLADGSTYTVSVSKHPADQICSVTNGTGTITANVTNVAITCVVRRYTIGGTVSGLGSARSAVLLVRAGGESTTLVANGAFAFPTQVPSNTPYDVTITTPPLGQRCGITNGSGKVASADVTNIAINCSIPVADNWVTNGRVSASALSADGNTVYIAGSFTRVGPRSGGGVPVDTISGAPAATYPRVEGMVYASAPDNAGGWYIGGAFRFVGGVPRNNIAHILADGSVDPVWNSNATATVGNASVRTIVTSGQTVYVGGEFTRIGGQARNALAALNATTGLAAQWDAAISGGLFWSSVYVLKLSNQTLYVGGGFTSIGGQPRNGLAALDITTALATVWNPSPDKGISSIEIAGNTVYLGGAFTSVGGQLRNNLAAVDALTGLASNWNPNAGGGITALAVSGQNLYVTGSFNTIGGQTRHDVAAIDRTTGLATAWDLKVTNGSVSMLAIAGQTLYLSGPFSSIGGQIRSNLAAVDTTTGLVTSWSPVVNDTVTSFGITGQTLYLGGRFSLVGGIVRNHIAALNTSTGIATDWNPDANGGVAALVVSGQTLYVAGGFTNIGGQTRNALAAFDITTGLVTSWNPNAYIAVGFPVTATVNKLAVSGQTVYVAGNFANVGGQPRGNLLAALDATTGLATAWNPAGGNSDTTLVVSGQTLYVGGFFTSIAGAPRSSAAAFDVVTGSLTGWNPSLVDSQSLQVFGIALSGSTAYLIGRFNTVGGQPSAGVTAVDASTGAPLGWNPYPTAPFLGWLTKTVVSNGQDVYVGGSVSLSDSTGNSHNNLVALNASTGLLTDWNPQVSSEVTSITVSSGVVYAGGSFTSVGGVMVGNFAFLPR